ncbi:MAG: ROK family protein [Alphaproteobacteria bacterium]
MQNVATFGNAQAPGAAAGRHAIGIDVGGTKIAGGVVDLVTGAISGRAQVPTDAARGGDAVLADVARMALDLLHGAQGVGVLPGALGIGVAELVDSKGEVFSDYRIKWRGLDVPGRLAAQMRDLDPGEIVVSSDVRAAALAEARYGAGRGGADFYYVTIGTGVSGVLVQNGQPYAGANGAGLVIASGSVRCTCPTCGHVEARVVEDIASGPALAAAFAPGCRAEDVVAAAQAGDARARAAIDHAVGALGPVLALLAGALDPDRLVIGGGLGSAPGPYFDTLTTAIRAGLWDGYRRDLPIVQAALGPDAGLIGAAAATMKAQEPVHRPAPAY